MVSALFCETSPIPVKEALNQMGYAVGECRLPLTTMEEANKEKLIKAMKEFGLLA